MLPRLVLLRRQLSQENPRLRPWIRIGRARRRSFIPPVWKRDWQTYLRFPLPRLARMVLMAALGGLAIGAVWRGTIPAILLAGFALYIVAYDAAEPTAQAVVEMSKRPVVKVRFAAAQRPTTVATTAAPTN